MYKDNARNTIIFVVVSIAIYMAYVFFVLQPAQKKKEAEATAQAAAHALHPNAPIAAAPEALTFISRAQAIAASPRVQILTPAIHGSLSLAGARIDDLYLSGSDPKQTYHSTVDKNSPPVELFTPSKARNAYFATFGWMPSTDVYAPDRDATWTLVSGTVLSPGKPVVLGIDNPGGLSFRRTITVDDKYMFTISDVVTNNAAAPVTLTPYGDVKRQGLPDDVMKNAFNVHQGAVGFLGENLQMFGYNDWKKKEQKDLDFFELKPGAKGGWLGITDKYWAAVMAPDQTRPVKGRFTADTHNGIDVYNAIFTGAPVRIDPGKSATQTTRLFAGAKRAEVLSAYEKKFGINNFDLTIDWGRLFWPLTRPITMVLDYFYSLVGNFGVAILLLTVVVKLLLFPLANQGFAAMSKMKKLQPQIEELKKKFGDDAQKQQQEMAALYQREKINPIAGCLPILLQFPVFISLLRVLAIAIGMRHAHFLWLDDLSVRDPSTIFTLFGLIDWDPASVPLIGGFLDGPLHLGIVAILYGGVMYLQQAMSPTTADPTQARIMKFMPIIFVFFMARYPVGLMIYWTWSALLSIIQQYFIMHRYKAENPIDDLIARLRGKPDASTVGG